MDCVKIVGVAVLMIMAASDGRSETTAPKNWQVHTWKDKFTSRKGVIVHTTSTDTFSCGAEFGMSATLAVRCFDGDTDLLIHTGCSMHSHDYSSTIKFRLDGGPIQKSRAGLSDSRHAYFLPGAKRLLRQWYGHSTIMTRTKARFDPPIITTFDITGIRVALEPVRKLCAW